MSECNYNNPNLSCSSLYILPVVQDYVNRLPKLSVILDLGCGNGSMLSRLRQHGWDLHGIEMSSSGLAEAQKAYPDIHFSWANLTSDLAAHPLAGKYDVVISTEVVEHVFLPRLFAKNSFAFLKPDGILIISTPYHGYFKNLVLALAGKMDVHFTALWDYGHIKFWSRRTLTLLLEEAGFQVKFFRGVGRISFLWKSMVIVATKPAGLDSRSPQWIRPAAGVQPTVNGDGDWSSPAFIPPELPPVLRGLILGAWIRRKRSNCGRTVNGSIRSGIASPSS